MATVSESPTNTSAKEFVSDSLALGVVFALVLTVVQRIVGFGRGILFCRYMTDQELGQWSLVWSFLMLLAPLAVLGLPGSFGRFVEYFRSRRQLKPFVHRVGCTSAFMTLALSLLILMQRDYVSWMIFREVTPLGRAIATSVGFSLVFVTAMNFLTSLMEAMRQVRLVTLMRFVLGIAFALIGTGFLIMFERATVAVTYGYAISCFLASIPAVWFLLSHRDYFSESNLELPNATLWRRIAPFAAWLWITNLFCNLFEVTDRYMLVHCSHVEAELAQGLVGQYHSGRVLPLLLVSVATMLGGILMPYMSAAWERGKPREAQRQLNWTVKLLSFCFTAGGIVFILLAPYLFEHVLQGRYDDGLAVLPLTLVYSIWFSLLTVGQDYLWVVEKGKLALAAITLGLIGNVLLNALLIPSFGLWGAVFATSIANLLALAGCYLCNHLVGCRTDLGVWATALLPLLLLLPVIPATLTLLTLLFAGHKTDWFLNVDEKADLAQLFDKLQSRLKKS